MKFYCPICNQQYKYEDFVKKYGTHFCFKCDSKLSFTKPKNTNFMWILYSWNLKDKCSNDEDFNKFCFECKQKFIHLNFGKGQQDFKLGENGHLVVNYTCEDKSIYFVYDYKKLFVILPTEYSEIFGCVDPFLCFV